MTSIDRLINEAHNTSVRISVLLRKALALATSTGDESFRTWLSYELSGYGPSQDIPDYRRPKGLLLGYGPFGHIAPVTFHPENVELEELMCCPPIGLPITKIEAELDVRKGDRSITATVNPVTMDAVREHWKVECAGIQYTTGDFQNILEGARTRLVASLAKLRSVPGPNLSVVTLFDGRAFTVIDGLASCRRHTRFGHAVGLQSRRLGSWARPQRFSSACRRTRKWVWNQRECHQISLSDHDLRWPCGSWFPGPRNARPNTQVNRESSSSNRLLRG